LARDQIPNRDFPQYAKIIHDQSTRLESLVNRLSELAKIPSPFFRPLSQTRFWEEVLYQAKLSPETKDLVIQAPDPETLPSGEFFGDLPQLVRAVHCMLQNAGEALTHPQAVQCQGYESEDRITLMVKDAGEGINPENLPFIFDPFFTTRFNHIGLGLTLAKRIIKEHQGEIEVESRPGLGTEVKILLPKDRRRPIRSRLL
jgi:signal transduction histidine kinase